MVTGARTWTVTSTRDHSFSSLFPAEATTAQTNAEIVPEDALRILFWLNLDPHSSGRAVFRGVVILAQIAKEGQRIAFLKE